MLYWTLVFLIIALVAGVLGFTGIYVAAAEIAKGRGITVEPIADLNEIDVGVNTHPDAEGGWEVDRPMSMAISGRTSTSRISMANSTGSTATWGAASSATPRSNRASAAH